MHKCDLINFANDHLSIFWEFWKTNRTYWKKATFRKSIQKSIIKINKFIPLCCVLLCRCRHGGCSKRACTFWLCHLMIMMLNTWMWHLAWFCTQVRFNKNSLRWQSIVSVTSSVCSMLGLDASPKKKMPSLWLQIQNI